MQSRSSVKWIARILVAGRSAQAGSESPAAHNVESVQLIAHVGQVVGQVPIAAQGPQTPPTQLPPAHWQALEQVWQAPSPMGNWPPQAPVQLSVAPPQPQGALPCSVGAGAEQPPHWMVPVPPQALRLHAVPMFGVHCPSPQAPQPEPQDCCPAR